MSVLALPSVLVVRARYGRALAAERGRQPAGERA